MQDAVWEMQGTGDIGCRGARYSGCWGTGGWDGGTLGESKGLRVQYLGPNVDLVYANVIYVDLSYVSYCTACFDGFFGTF